MIADVGTYLRLFDRDGGHFALLAESAPSVDAAVEQWIASGHTRDAILHLTTTEGEACCILASHVASWIMSTPEGRRRGIEIEASFKAERAEQRRLAGLPWEEPEER